MKPVPLDAQKDSIGRKRDSWSERRERDERTSDQRKLADSLLLHHLAEAGALAAKRRSVRRHDHPVHDRPDYHLEIEARDGAGRDVDSVARHGPEPRQLDVHAVVAGRKAGPGIDPVGARDHEPLNVGVDVGDLHRGAGDAGATLVANDARQRAGADLREGRPGADEDADNRDRYGFAGGGHAREPNIDANRGAIRPESYKVESCCRSAARAGGEYPVRISAKAATG